MVRVSLWHSFFELDWRRVDGDVERPKSQRVSPSVPVVAIQGEQSPLDLSKRKPPTDCNVKAVEDE